MVDVSAGVVLASDDSVDVAAEPERCVALADDGGALVISIGKVSVGGVGGGGAVSGVGGTGLAMGAPDAGRNDEADVAGDAKGVGDGGVVAVVAVAITGVVVVAVVVAIVVAVVVVVIAAVVVAGMSSTMKVATSSPSSTESA